MKHVRENRPQRPAGAIGRAAMLLVALALLAAPAHALAQAVKKSNKRPAPAGAEGPADYSSVHFLVHTDLSNKEAQELLKRLETMLDLISKYWARPPVGIIECYVVKDLDKWPPGVLDPHGRAKIEEGAGVTLTQSATLTVGGAKHLLAKAVVYAIADHGTPQHEAVHAYCGQNFGSCGPLWYAEGMAEMGQYWRPNDSAVHIHPTVLDYLQSTPPQTLRDIVETKSTRMTGDSWQNYAWRWALCHLLANNLNYRDRFRPLGLGLLTEEKVSFEQTYGAMADEISFEYLFFVKHVEQGYRVDLCSWDWKKKFKPLMTGAPITARVAADHGWQASSVTCLADQEYEYSTQGTWQTGKGKETGADGDTKGTGRLVGVLMQDYQLTKPFDLGSYGTFKAPSAGKLYLRCQDKWSELADNKGAITVKLKLAGKGTPLSKPKERSALADADPPAPGPDESESAESKTSRPKPSTVPDPPAPARKKIEAPKPGPDPVD